MNKILLLGGLLALVLGTIGCACYAPGYGAGNYGVSCGNVIAPYSCGPSSCGGAGVDYVDGGPGAANANCAGCYSSGYMGYRGFQSGYYGNGDCRRCITNGLRVVGEGAVGLIAAPFVLVGSLFNCGAYANFQGCGCSNEVYYGDNCYQPHDFCDPCAGNACGPAGPDRVGHAYPPTAPGCSHCNSGYREGIQPGEPVSMAPAPLMRRSQSNILQSSMQRPLVQNQQPVMLR